MSVLLALVVLSSGAGSLASLKSHLGTAIETPRPNELRYCPDNTCETFVAAGDDSVEALPAFVFLYLFRKSDYIYLSEPIGGATPFRTAAASDADMVARSAARFCKDPTPTIDCVLEGMTRELKIEIGFIRYGE